MYQIEKETENSSREIFLGIDIGSTTVKLAALDPETGELLYSDYRRHFARQIPSVIEMLEEMEETFPTETVRVIFTGSGAKGTADRLSVPFIQEVAANALALKEQYGHVGSAIEIGGQDAKIIFFRKDAYTGETETEDMRMNGSCAGGTGAFIDEIASLLRLPVEEFDDAAAKGSCVYDISGRCGVYAKTDIQPLLNQGAAKEDLALSTFHAIAKQTIGGLAQGMEIKKPVAFEGGPLTFNKTLVRVFAERLNLSETDYFIPKHPELMVARGAALSLKTMFREAGTGRTVAEYIRMLKESRNQSQEEKNASARPFFETEQEREDFQKTHATTPADWKKPQPGETVRAFLGIDSGSTTTKFVLIGENEELLYSFYASNEGEPLRIAQKALIDMRDRYRKAGAELKILASGSTGYGELLFHKAFQTEYHTVETVAHARAASRYENGVSFILDIGGQDMKAIWMEDGIITNILVNEACSSGCGSFLENFAASLHIKREEIASAAFSSRNPAVLGSRCTVFMNSSIITEQRNGKKPEDIMAGLCRSIIENVFTKVIRVSNLDSLGEKIVVQGGTFENDAVLRAMEEYLGRSVTRAPHPGLTGAIGIALIAKEKYEKNPAYQTFGRLDDLEAFTFQRKTDEVCPFCGNHCKRTVLLFSNGNYQVTNNRCERGEILELSGKDGEKKEPERGGRVPDLYQFREKLLFQEYPCPEPKQKRNITIGLPRVLSFWETMPFWTTFFRTLGFDVVLSGKSTHRMYESGLSAVTSDTVCFPAKLVHGHLRDLVKKRADRIFMPSITTVPSENTESTSQSMCAVVKGYPIVIRNSDNPEKQWGVPFDAPLFHWYHTEDRNRQICAYMSQTYGIPERETKAAVKAADEAQASFQRQLKEAGKAVIEQAEREGTYAVVLASRPYHNDPLVNHNLPRFFTELGIPVLTADSLPDLEKTDLSRSRIDIVNNYHARMLSAAIAAAKSPCLEYVQVVSFGCGHDAYLSDEIIRMMREISGKAPLILKLDESEIQGPLRIRIRSFIETVSMKKEKGIQAPVRELADPYPAKFTKKDRKERVVLVPNTSHAFCRIMSAALSTQGIRAVPLEVGREEAIKLGKQYVHNDICFPAQIVIGEALAALKSGKYDPDRTAIGMAKYIGDCRLTHYGALLRKALDDAGFAQVPVLTNDDKDYHNMHPGFRMNLLSALRLAFALPMIDALEELLRKIRPYELTEGSAERAFERGMDALVDGLEKQGIHGAEKGFQKAVEEMERVSYDRTSPRPQVLIVGEYLLNFHPGANHEIEKYLEKNGFEVVEARMTDVIRKTYFYQDAQNREYRLKRRLPEKTWSHVANQAFTYAHDLTDRIACRHPLYQKATRMEDLVKRSDPIIHHTFDAGEGVLIAGEIMHHAEEGCRSFIILQPFGCLPNHIVGRGIVKEIKECYPQIQILTLDYDPDVSFANIENRLQMMIMQIKKGETEQVSNNTEETENKIRIYRKKSRKRLTNTEYDDNIQITTNTEAKKLKQKLLS